MNCDAAATLVWVIVLGSVVAVWFAIDSSDNNSAHEGPLSEESVKQLMKLQNSGPWMITILRRSGYEHSACISKGNCYAAIELAFFKMRQARIYKYSIVKNTDNKLEVRAYFDSTGSRRTGKYIGGFEIARRA